MHSFPWTRGVHGALVLFAASTGLVVAQDVSADTARSNSQQTAYRSSIAQESVRKQTDKIQAEIDQLVSELKLNGLDDSDLAILTDASTHLQSLSQQDMQKVINALQNASMAAQDPDREKSLVSAYEDQKAVSLKLKSLAADMAAQESQKEIPSKIERLIARQSANIRQTKTLGASGLDQLNAGQKITHDVASAEQGAIGGEIDLLGKILSAKSDTPPAPGTPDIAKTVLEAMNSGPLKDATAAATQLTSAGPFADAVGKQATVREALTALLRTALSNIDAVTRLEEVKALLTLILNDQMDLGSVSQEGRLDGATLAERQAKIEDRTSVANALLEAVSPPASSQLTETETAMEQSSGALATAKTPADSAPQQKVVVDDLQKTEKLLDQQIADAEKSESMSPTDMLAALQNLQNQLDNAQKNPQTSAADLQKMQQEAAPISPQAASKIDDAASQLQQPQPNQAASNQSLADASAAVQQQMKDMAQDAQAYQALANASEALKQAQQNASQASQSLQANDASKNFTEAAHDLTQSQGNLSQAQQAAQQASAAQDAQQAMQQASDALKESTNQAVQAQGGKAQDQDKKAMDAMQKAQDSLGQAMAALQQKSQNGKGKGKGQGQGQGQAPMVTQNQRDPGTNGSAQSGQKMQGDANPKGARGGSNTGRALAGVGSGGGSGLVMGGLQQKDRDAIEQYQAEKSPPEYAPMVQQYLKNLADSSSAQ